MAASEPPGSTSRPSLDRSLELSAEPKRALSAEPKLGRGVPGIAVGRERLAARYDPPSLDLDPVAHPRTHWTACERGAAIAIVQAGDAHDVLVGRPVQHELGAAYHRDGATDLDPV